MKAIVEIQDRPRCSKCRAREVNRIGYRVKKGGERVARFQCQACGSTFNYKPVVPRPESRKEVKVAVVKHIRGPGGRFVKQEE